MFLSMQKISGSHYVYLGLGFSSEGLMRAAIWGKGLASVPCALNPKL